MLVLKNNETEIMLSVVVLKGSEFKGKVVMKTFMSAGETSRTLQRQAGCQNLNIVRSVFTQLLFFVRIK